MSSLHRPAKRQSFAASRCSWVRPCASGSAPADAGTASARTKASRQRRISTKRSRRAKPAVRPQDEGHVIRAVDERSLAEPMKGTAAEPTVPPMNPVTLSALEIVRPGDERYDEARPAWNLAVDQPPAAVAIPRDADQVVAAVLYAKREGLRVAAQGTGHNASPLGDLSDTLLIKTHEMRGVEIDAKNRIARVEAGAQWGDVIGPAGGHGLPALPGPPPHRGVLGPGGGAGPPPPRGPPPGRGRGGFPAGGGLRLPPPPLRAERDPHPGGRGRHSRRRARARRPPREHRPVLGDPRRRRRVRRH